MLKFISIAIGGALGSLARYYLSNSTLKNFIYMEVPLAILIINIIGSFAFGILMGLVESNIVVSNSIKNFLIFGFIAAFTTFSTFAWEAINLIHNEMYLKMIFYCLISVALSIFFCFAGYHLGK